MLRKTAHGVCMMQDRKGSDPGYPVPGTWHLTPCPIPPFQILTEHYRVTSNGE